MNSSTVNSETAPEMHRNLALLKELPFFSAFPLQALKILALLATRGDFLPGDLLYEKGDDTDRAYLILEGCLVLTTSGENGTTEIIRKFMAGDFIGSLSLFGPNIALFDLRAEKKTRVLTIDRKQFQKILKQFPEVQALSLKAILKEINRWERTNISEAAPCCFSRLGVTAL